MAQWQIKRQVLERHTKADTDIHDLTEEIRRGLKDSGVREGTCVIFAPGATASITTIEYEPGALEDLKQAIARIAPSDAHYAHDARWGDGNGYSHVRAALLGPSLSVPIYRGDLELGTWQQIILLDFDNRPRDRQIVVQFSGIGEKR